MFPTKTSRDVGMVDGVSDATSSSMEKPTGRKRPGTRRCIPCLCNYSVNIHCLQDTLWIDFHHPYIWQHFDVALLSWPQHMCDNKYLSTNSCMEDDYEFHMSCGQSFNLYWV